MLVLTRRPGEAVLLGEEVEITVVSVRGDQVRLGIEAPRELRVCRREIVVQVERENAAAAAGATALRESPSVAQEGRRGSSRGRRQSKMNVGAEPCATLIPQDERRRARR